ncbi:hypothetical protein KAH27_03810 [bacterium]|nr:hypothetical protein [bacterium]
MNITNPENFFLIAGAVGPPENYISVERMNEAADAGIDFIIPLGPPKSKEENISLLNIAHKANIKMFISDKRCSLVFMDGYSDIVVNEDTVNNVANDYRDYPALFAYDIMDEPACKHFEELGKTVELFKKYDSYNLAFINLFPGYVFPETLGTLTFEEYVTKYIEVVKPSVFCYDHYPIRVEKSGKGCFSSFCMDNADSGWYDDLEIVRRETRKAKIPFWMFIQSTGIKNYLRIPKRTEILWQANTALAYGARGILWFCYWTPDSATEPYLYAMIDKGGNRTELYDYVRKENRFLKKAGNELLEYDNAEIARYKNSKIISGTSSIVTMVGNDYNIVIGTFIKNNKIRIVCVNDDVNNQTKFSIILSQNYKFVNTVAEIDAAINSNLELKIAPGGCIILELTKD